MSKAVLMIVDDNPANLKVLEEMLQQQGYQVRSFPRGRLALVAAAQNPPDLILLDINMPEMNGYEVCERLRTAEATSGIPIIFLSALDGTEDKMMAFRSGGVDYISKPFKIEEVHARVETHLKLHALRQTLKEQNEHLEEAVAARTCQLAEANARLAILDRSKSDFLNLISHELRTPLNGLLGIGELILYELPSTEENGELKELFERSGQRILSIIEDALLLTEIDVSAEKFTTNRTSLFAALSRAVEHTTAMAESRHVKLHLHPLELGVVLGEADLLTRAFRALLETAVRFSEAGETVRVECRTSTDLRLIIIESAAGQIPSAVVAKFFDIFSIGEALTPGGELGLRPAVAHRIFSLFGASVCVENLHPAGIRLRVSWVGAVKP